MKKNISDVLHNADNETVERIAGKYRAADEKASERIYDKCVSRIGSEYEQVELMKAETVRRGPKLYPVLAAAACIMIIFGSIGVLLHKRAHEPLPVNDSSDNMATVTTSTGTAIVSNAAVTMLTTNETAKDSDPETTSAANEPVETLILTESVRTSASSDRTVTKAVKTTTVKKTTAKTVTTQKSTDKTTVKRYLNTKDITSLSQKGDSLTWSDFEDYIYEDIGSGIYIWEFKIEEGTGYTLRIGGVPPEKPNYIKLYHGINGIDTQNGIDIRYNDVQEFINMPNRVSSAMNQIKELIPDSIASIEISDNVHSNTEKLTYDQIKILLSRLNDISLIEESGSYQLLSCINYKIKITLHNRNTIDLGLVGSYFIINGKGYKAESDSCSQLETYICNFITNTKEPENIDISGLSTWCWHDYWSKSFDSRNINESIIVSAFPDTEFTWNGLEGGITVYRNGTAAAAFGGMPLWNAFFTDLNGDGSPELCMTVSFGSGIVDEHVIVYDLRNEKEYTLWERMVNDYILFMEDNELFVRKLDTESSISSFWEKSRGEKGRLKINESDELVFVPVS